MPNHVTALVVALGVLTSTALLVDQTTRWLGASRSSERVSEPIAARDSSRREQLERSDSAPEPNAALASEAFRRRAIEPSSAGRTTAQATRAPVPVAAPPATASTAVEPRPSLELCDAGVRIAGAYVRPGAGQPLVMFSGPDVRRRGLRTIGGHVAGRVVTAIRSDRVVLRDTGGDECRLEMSSAHAREILERERGARLKRINAGARAERAAARRDARDKKKRSRRDR